MAITEVNKLVRDRIPGLILKTGKMPEFRFIEDEGDFIEALKAKLLEEVYEYLEDGSIEELADVFQVICTIAETVGGGKRELEYISFEKTVERGGFENKVFLESIDDGK
ncbi:MAG: nucleoside triphosphate pyrophosphohydrolase [Candidatus Methanoplasma sp.]|nr:nucleoside triphosphate pyrophosphohydrolase [Candidatus Methanoplasma sp.]